MTRDEAAREIDNTACCFSDKKFRNALHMAAAALRDMLKRREGCDFCNESEQIQNPYGDIMEMDDGVLILDTEGYPRVTFRIKYCPDCGRELSGNAEQVKEAGNEQAGSVRIP